MRDIYLYEGSKVLRNLLGIRDQAELEKAEADYVSFRLKDIARNPLQGHYDYAHLLQMHRFIFQDLYDWAGQQRKVNIYKEEAVLGGLSIDYSDVFDIARDAEKVLAEMRHKEWQNMSIHSHAGNHLLRRIQIRFLHSWFRASMVRSVPAGYGWK
jgi:cell filamentation protein